jgi:MFS superfamily sulfate permease-like transporter
LRAAAVVLPKAMAYATVAGLPVSVGLYRAFVPMIVYAFLGTSRVLSVSSTTTLAILVAAQLGATVPDGDAGRLITATATLTALTGLLLIAASLLRLGLVANFISAPVLTGFKAGIGLVIVLDQIPKILGVHFAKDGLVRDVVSLFGHVPEASSSPPAPPTSRGHSSARCNGTGGIHALLLQHRPPVPRPAGRAS